MKNILETGSVNFWIHHKNPKWIEDDNAYNFPTMTESGITVSVDKLPNQVIELAISGPHHQTFSFSGPIPISDVPAVMVTFVWEGRNIKLYLNANVVVEMNIELIERANIDFTLESPGTTVSLQAIGETLLHFGNLLCGISAYIESSDNLALCKSIEYGLEKHKFELESAQKGSLKGIISGSRKVLSFTKEHISDLLIFAHDFSKKYAEATLTEKQAKAAIAKNEAIKSNLEVIEKANQVALKIGNDLDSYAPNISPETRHKIISSSIIQPLELLSKSLMENNLTMTVKESNQEEKLN